MHLPPCSATSPKPPPSAALAEPAPPPLCAPQVLDGIKKKPYDLLDSGRNEFDLDLLEFSVNINDLEMALLVGAGRGGARRYAMHAVCCWGAGLAGRLKAGGLPLLALAEERKLGVCATLPPRPLLRRVCSTSASRRAPPRSSRCCCCASLRACCAASPSAPTWRPSMPPPSRATQVRSLGGAEREEREEAGCTFCFR